MIKGGLQFYYPLCTMTSPTLHCNVALSSGLPIKLRGLVDLQGSLGFSCDQGLSAYAYYGRHHDTTCQVLVRKEETVVLPLTNVVDLGYH